MNRYIFSTFILFMLLASSACGIKSTMKAVKVTPKTQVQATTQEFVFSGKVTQ